MTETRERIVSATSALFMERGYAGSGLKQIAATSAAPIGSLYHFFPGGKAELAAATLRASGRQYQALVEGVMDAAPNVLTAIDDCFAGAAETLRSTGYADACPIATVALEVASSDEPLRLVTAEIFASWLTSLAQRFVAVGIEARRAGELAEIFLAALEGGFLLSRVAKDTGPMETLGRAVAELARTAIQDRSTTM